MLTIMNVGNTVILADRDPYASRHDEAFLNPVDGFSDRVQPGSQLGYERLKVVRLSDPWFFHLTTAHQRPSAESTSEPGFA